MLVPTPVGVITSGGQARGTVARHGCQAARSPNGGCIAPCRGATGRPLATPPASHAPHRRARCRVQAGGRRARVAPGPACSPGNPSRSGGHGTSIITQPPSNFFQLIVEHGGGLGRLVIGRRQFCRAFVADCPTVTAAAAGFDTAPGDRAPPWEASGWPGAAIATPFVLAAFFRVLFGVNATGGDSSIFPASTIRGAPFCDGQCSIVAHVLPPCRRMECHSCNPVHY